MKRIAVVGALLLAGCTAKPAAAPPQVLAADVAYPSGKETVRGYLCRPLGGGPRPALVVIHGDRGLDAATKRHARRLAGLGYVALAVDLYRGERADDVLDAHIMDRGLPDEQVFRDLKSAVGYLTSRSDVRAGAVGVVGHDMGGGYVLDAAVRDPRLKAVVTCYGRLTTDPQWLRPLQAPVLGIFAGNDEGITPQTIEQFRRAMDKAGKRLAGVHVYAGAAHGFLDPNLPNATAADEAARKDAWRQMESFLAGELKP